MTWTRSQALSGFAVETPSWGYGDSGTRFGVFPQPGRPRDVFERIEDAAEVHRLTGTAPAVALHFPWDDVDDLGELRDARRGARAARSARSTPTSSRIPTTSSARSPTRTRASARRPSTTCSSASRSPPTLGSTAQSLWLADGTNYAGQDDLRTPAPDGRLPAEVYAALPDEQELLVEYKFFEPAFYATDIADWGSALLLCQRARRARAGAGRPRPPRAGRQRRADRRAARRRGPARRLSLQQPQVRRRRPDRRLGQPVRAVPDLRRAAAPGRTIAAADDRSVPQRRGQGRGDGAERRQPAGGLRQGAARRPRRARRGASEPATCWAATSCCSTPSTPTCGRCCARVRERLGAAEDPVAELRALWLRRHASRAERGATDGSGRGRRR